MRQIKILKNTEHAELRFELEKRITQSLAFEVSNDELVQLLDRIKKDDSEAIPNFLKASEGMIYRVMLSIPNSRFSIDERLNFAKQALENLAVKELNSTGREILLRFGAFQVRQSLIEMEGIQNADFEPNKN